MKHYTFYKPAWWRRWVVSENTPVASFEQNVPFGYVSYESAVVGRYWSQTRALAETTARNLHEHTTRHAPGSYLPL